VKSIKLLASVLVIILTITTSAATADFAKLKAWESHFGEAIQNQDLPKAIEMLQSRPIDSDAQLIDQLLLLAYKLDDKQAATELIDTGANIDAYHYGTLFDNHALPDSDSRLQANGLTEFSFGDTLLMLAVRQNAKKWIQFLVDNGADIGRRNHYSLVSPLFLAYNGDNKELLHWLISFEKDINKPRPPCLSNSNMPSETLLHRHLEQDGLVEFLLENGADPNCRNHAGHTPAHYMFNDQIREGQNDRTFQLLVKAGANLDLPDNQGKTPLHWAVSNGNLRYIRTLLNGGANANILDNLGRTPLHYAITRERADIAQYLLTRGADPGVTSPKSVSALEAAAVNPDPKIRKVFKAYEKAFK